MKIDETTVDHIANLAKLEFDKEAKADIIKDLNKIIEFVDKLNELDTSKVEPLVFMTEETNVLRADEVKSTNITHPEALMNAPKKDSDYFKAPKVIE